MLKHMLFARYILDLLTYQVSSCSLSGATKILTMYLFYSLEIFMVATALSADIRF